MNSKLSKNKLEEYIYQAQKGIKHCLTCQAYESGEEVWMCGKRISMTEYLESFRIPERYWDAVASSLECPNCNAPLDIMSDIGLSNYKIESEQYIEKLIKSWYDKYEDQLSEFYEFLEKYPYLGLSHRFGKKIKKFVSELIPKIITNDIWYRAREKKSSDLFSSQDFYPPDPNEIAISEGRFNHFGQQVFYLSETEESAIKEILEKDNGIAGVQKFKINELAKIIDLTVSYFYEHDDDISVLAFGLIYIGAFFKPVIKSKGWKPEYFISRFIADCVRAQGFNGIIFYSNRHSFKNMVLFSWDAESINPIGNPEIYSLAKKNDIMSLKRIEH